MTWYLIHLWINKAINKSVNKEWNQWNKAMNKSINKTVNKSTIFGVKVTLSCFKQVSLNFTLVFEWFIDLIYGEALLIALRGGSIFSFETIWFPIYDCFCKTSWYCESSLSNSIISRQQKMQMRNLYNWFHVGKNGICNLENGISNFKKKLFFQIFN